MMRKGAKCVLVCVFLLSTGLFLYRSVLARAGADGYEKAAQIAYVPAEGAETVYVAAEDAETAGIVVSSEREYDSEESMEMPEFHLQALQDVNPDVLGWISIPDTVLSYPLVQGTDNSYYLDHTWEKESGTVGAIFLDMANASDLSDFHCILYGHRMLDGSMFGSLKYYKDQAYADEHPCVYLTDAEGSHCYEIFAAYETPVTGNTYKKVFSDEAEKQEFLEACTAQSVIEMGIVPGLGDKILTMSTCTGRGYDSRWVVQARLAD